MTDLIKIMHNCIKKEADALLHIADTIDDVDISFLKKIHECSGNVIISGIGKSFIVGKKIAGTFSSIGVPTIAISISDMLHGNIGMLSKNDIIIIISNSGETKEVIEFARHLKMIGNFTILSITGNKKSTLAKLSDISKEIKVIEAGPYSIIPTTSTTATMAYGDAIASALAHCSGLTLSTFKKYHPAGKIGSIL